MVTGPRALHPPALDLSRPDAELRPICAAALQSLTPALEVLNHGCEQRLREMAAAAQHTITRDADGPPPPQQAHDLDGSLAPDAEALRGCLRRVGLRVLGLALGVDEPSLVASLGADELDLEGRLCIRAYAGSVDAASSPPPPTQRLGAHCDSVLLTLLWSDAPGLEVLDPVAASEWTPEAVLSYGLPTMGDASEPAMLRDDQWARIELDWAKQPLLFTVGTSWLRHPLTTARAPARCAALHRVCVPTTAATPRHSLPFLADLVPRSSSAARRDSEAGDFQGGAPAMAPVS